MTLLVERAVWMLGVLALTVWGAANWQAAAGSRDDLERFAAARAMHRPTGAGQGSLAQTTEPDLSLWNPRRIAAWRAVRQQPGPAPLAILRIPKIRLEVAVLPGTGEVELNRGLGHIEETALPGTDGNSGIAGHRDGFFRGLKDIQPGDAIELETLAGREVYRVERTWIVNPEDVAVLEPTAIRSLTLVTCYPFYVIGSAPQRFIVRAHRA